MDIEEVKRRKRLVELEILSKITEFEKKTNTRITEFELQRSYCMGDYSDFVNVILKVQV